MRVAGIFGAGTQVSDLPVNQCVWNCCVLAHESNSRAKSRRAVTRTNEDLGMAYSQGEAATPISEALGVDDSDRPPGMCDGNRVMPVGLTCVLPSRVGGNISHHRALAVRSPRRICVRVPALQR